MDNFKEWVKDNRILVGAVVVLTLILIVLLTFNQAKTPMERGLEADSAKTQQLQEQKEDTQKEVQEKIGVTIDIPSKEAIRKEIDEAFSEVYADSGYGVDYQGTDVLNWIAQTYGEDVELLQLDSAYPDINLTREDQQALNIKLLDVLGQGNYVELDVAPLKVNAVSTIANNANIVNKTIGARYYKENADDLEVVGDYLYYLGLDEESRIYLNDNYTSVETGNVNVINPLVLRHNEESEIEGIGSPHTEIVFHVSPKEDMPLGELFEEASNIEFGIGTSQITFNEQVGLDVLKEAYQEGGVDLTKMVSPLQTVEFTVSLTDTINPELPYVELTIGGQTLVINQGDVSQSVPMR